MILVNKIIAMAQLDDSRQKNTAIAWTLITIIIVLIFHIKLIAKHILQNNLVGVFKSDPRYGPPDADDRKKRRDFNELYESRQCTHDCVILDEKYECNHLPLIFKNYQDGTNTSGLSSSSSLTNIYDASPSKKRISSVIDASVLRIN